jgi:hypothetical protein
VKGYLQLIDEVFAIAGMTYDKEPEPKPVPEGGYDNDNPYAQLNDDALLNSNLPKWVTDLNLYGLRRNVGRHPNYRAVASIRPSTTGRKLEERELNLSISSKGIKDHGTGQGYSPINLVMAARGCSRAEAIGFLQERLYASPVSESAIDYLVEKLKEAPETSGNDGDDGDTKVEDEDALIALTGGFWEHGDPLPEQVPMLIPYFVPQTGVGYVGGDWGGFKTFILNDMAVGVSSAGTFAGQQVAERGCVMQIELEGSQNEVRISGASSARGIKDRLPIRVFTQMPPKILGPNKRVTLEWKRWCRGMKIQSARMAEKFGIPVRLVTVDPVNTVAGWTDEQSSAEGQAVYEGLLYLSQQLKCVVVAADHYGKAPGQGLRGTSVKETAALFILGTSPRDKDLAARRFLEIRKMKNGLQNVAMDFFVDAYSFTAFRKVEKYGAETLEPMDVKTLAIRWDGELHPTDEKRGDDDEITPAQHKILSVMKDLLPIHGVDCAESPMGQQALPADMLGKKCVEDKICASVNTFYKQKAALKGKRIGVSKSGDLVWFLMG